ncbi:MULTISPECIES: hypothetical protein [unclassified Variovorax]|uniref:hypothetical protein n=1 Tax=unclassified Variovorax TaxID=663243 RepID=UPI001BD25ABD|nr:MULTISPECIES: hypothetical protein [unclassified Variovorax]
MDRLAELMGPFTAIVDDMPQGAGPSLRFELQAHITWYEEMDRIGSEHFVVMLVDGRNEVAAVCNAHWDARFPDRLFQALTGVTRPWRGKGLAKAMKAAMLELVHTRHLEVQMIITSNAEMNAPILSINQRLGFAVHRCNGQYQLDRQALRDFLAFRATPASPSTNAH